MSKKTCPGGPSSGLNIGKDCKEKRNSGLNSDICGSERLKSHNSLNVLTLYRKDIHFFTKKFVTVKKSRYICSP